MKLKWTQSIGNIMSKEEDKIGFKNPPKKHQFRKGQSSKESEKNCSQKKLGTLLTPLTETTARMSPEVKMSLSVPEK